MEGVAVQKPLFCIGPLFGRLFVNGGDPFECCNHMLAEDFPILQGFRFEEAAAQNLGHILLDHRLYGLLPLALKNIIKLGLDLTSQAVALARVRCQQ